MDWPKYESLTPQAFSLAHLRYFFSDWQSLKAIGTVMILIALYLLGIHLSLPLANTQHLHQIISSSQMLTIIDELFTGGALGNLAPFALGIFPLFFLQFGSMEVIRGRLRRGTRVTLRSLSAITILAVLIIAWFAVIKVIPVSALSIIVYLIYLLGGSLLLFIIENRLIKYGGPDILYLNALLIGIIYIRSLFLNRHVAALIIGSLIVCFVLSFAFLITKVDEIHLSNIREEQVREGVLPIPATNSFLCWYLLLFTLIFAACVIGLINLLSPFQLKLFGASLPDVTIIILAQAGVSLLFARQPLIDAILSQFSGGILARRLRINNWIVPGIETGTPTAHFLAYRARRSHRATYIFYLIWVVVFSAVGFGAQLAHLPIPPLPFGPLGFIIILTFGSQIVFNLGHVIRGYAQRINYREFWTTMAETRIERQEIAIRTNLEEIINEILANIPELSPEEKEKLHQWLKSGDLKNIPRFLETIQAHFARQAQEVNNITVGKVVRMFLLCTGISLACTLIVVFIVQIFFGQLLSDPGFKAGLLISCIGIFIGTELGIIPLFGLDKNVKKLLKQLSEKRKRKKNTDLL